MMRRIPLSSAYSEIAQFWCYKKNCGFGPEDFSSGSNVLAWWICVADKRHIFQQSIADRVASERNSKVYGHGCPYCASKKICLTNSLQSLYPAIANEWHPTKNGKVTPGAVAAQANKKAWWLCPKCRNDWHALISNRIAGSGGCPYCRGMRPSKQNNLLSLFPKIAAQWHPTKNRPLTADQVTAKSNKFVWWQCSAARDHVWQTKVEARTNAQTSCPFCVGKRASTTNSIASLFPKLAKEWHPIKNGDLKAKDVTKGSMKRVWWQCREDPQHEWQTLVLHRASNGSGCPFCHRARRAARSM